MDELFNLLGKAWKFVVALFACCTFVVIPILKECSKTESPTRSVRSESSYENSFNSHSSSSSPSSSNDYYTSPSNYGSTGTGNYNNSYDNNSYDNSSNRSNYSKPERKWHECSLCNGKGTIIRDSSVPTYGEDHQVYCSECGRNYWASTGHSHIRCPECRGKRGYWTE